MTRPLVIYHGPGCMDGAAAALAAWFKFGEDAEYRPAQYGDPAPTDEEVRGRDVYVLDFSYPREELERMERACDSEPLLEAPLGRLRVIDHHKTAQADLTGLPFCTFDMGKSGAVLAWEHFNSPGFFKRNPPDITVPELFAYVQDRDLWQWKLPHSREVSAALAASGALTDFRKLIPIYNMWEHRMVNSTLVREGAAILRAECLMVERIVASAEAVEIELTRLPGGELLEYIPMGDVPAGSRPHRIGFLAATSAVLQSEVGEALALESARRGRDAVGAVYYRDGKAGKWRVSLRSREVRRETDHASLTVLDAPDAPDVSDVAKSFGGGGHARAAGFECEELPWVKS